MRSPFSFRPICSRKWQPTRSHSAQIDFTSPSPCGTDEQSFDMWETHIGKHTLGNTLLDASMSPLNTRQRHALAASILPLLNTMKPNLDMSHQKPLDSLLHVAMVSANDNKYNVCTHPEQGGEQITEAYLQGMSEVECIWRFRYASLLCI